MGDLEELHLNDVAVDLPLKLSPSMSNIYVIHVCMSFTLCICMYFFYSM